MSNKLIRTGNNGGGAIVNPFAQTVLTLKVDDQFNSELNAPNMHPAQVVKVLMNVMFDVLFTYVDAVSSKEKKDESAESGIIK